MKKDLGSKPVLFPLEVLVIAAYDEDGVPCAMNAGWGMLAAMDKVMLFIDEDHKTTANILASRAFTVSFATRDTMVPADFLGIATGNKMPDKFARSGFHEHRAPHVNAPLIDELPVTLECELVDTVSVENVYGVIGKIVNVLAEEDVLDEKGRIDIDEADLISFDFITHEYRALGEVVGTAWNAGMGLMKD